jgi:16S rRNA (guanine(527)-N(7))-methyltransferase RsmG
VSCHEILDAELLAARIDLPSPQRLRLVAYCDELVRWNQKINLTGLKGPEMVRRLVVEPIWIGQQLKLAGKMADIGSGNGSPAIPLQIVCGFEACYLIEVRSKRAVFLRQLISGLKLKGTSVYRARFEDVAATLGEVHWVTLQGVALGRELIDSVRRYLPLTTIMWITSTGAPKLMEPIRRLRVPFTSTEVFLFRTDHP